VIGLSRPSRDLSRRSPAAATADVSRRSPAAATADVSRRSPAAATADVSRRSPAGAKAEDLTLVALAGVHTAVLVAAPIAPVIAIGLWWNANTISHYFIHRPFFHRRSANRAFAAFLSVLLGF